MKKLIAVLLVIASLNLPAFAADGNHGVMNAREYLTVVANGNKGTAEELQGWNWWTGLVIGLTQAYGSSDYFSAICYPDGATYDQASEIAANYVIAHPEKRTKLVSDLVWEAHFDAFGTKSNSDCWDHDSWAANHP
jgi:hypothetical protein